jgi:hypothetical protein
MTEQKDRGHIFKIFTELQCSTASSYKGIKRVCCVSFSVLPTSKDSSKGQRGQGTQFGVEHKVDMIWRSASKPET